MGGSNFVTLGAIPDPQNDQLSLVAINVLSQSAVTVVAAVASKRIQMFGAYLVSTASVTMTPQDISASATVNLSGPILFEPGTPHILDYQNYPWFTVSAGSALVFNMGASVQLSGRIICMQG